MTGWNTNIMTVSTTGSVPGVPGAHSAVFEIEEVKKLVAAAEGLGWFDGLNNALGTLDMSLLVSTREILHRMREEYIAKKVADLLPLFDEKTLAAIAAARALEK
jgi:hypothetical protein